MFILMIKITAGSVQQLKMDILLRLAGIEDIQKKINIEMLAYPHDRIEFHPKANFPQQKCSLTRMELVTLLIG